MKVGDKVKSNFFGEGVIVNINMNNKQYPIKVEFINRGYPISYTIDGLYVFGDSSSLDIEFLNIGEENLITTIL